MSVTWEHSEIQMKAVALYAILKEQVSDTTIELLLVVL
jgi:hypothetical protein